ncbi:GcrA family cell cycle regulator [Bradyrhizobium sp. ARR65]|uniref:GcrA family cell cycle regulator n=1 Tax=Bradyrhizobium sp. ARR65 TaxID=1040989 RepID=UPI00046558F3|nr:GcrA family cell cycle regulator [Bradyrhizobium sp. ARR65]
MSAIQPTWTTERIELLKIHFAAGLTCREIAERIGVSRNAVIGKISRLNLMRDKAGPARKERSGEPRKRAASRLRRQILRAVSVEETRAAEEPIANGHRCSLFELSKQTCRWPLSTPGAADFCFCGNPPLEGLPYCPGHSRLAYRISAR